ncbi:MAG: hypothetical protein K2X06_02045 [Burkholderiales bacterium]|nr:hypothetical protein [Burkholderiales bacterium]
MENVIGSNPSTNSGAANLAEGFLSKASSGAHNAVDSMAGAASDTARKSQPAIEQVAAMAHQAVDKVAGAAGPTADWLAQQGETLNATQKKLMTDTCSYVSANPLKSVGIALLAGFVLSRIIR